MIPVIGLLASALTAVGGYTLYWYSTLSRDEQEQADRAACEYARELYGKGLDELTSAQLSRVHELVKGRFAA